MAEDITRSTFNPLKHYSGVRQQQGRVSMDADWNEQVDIASYRAQTGTVDTFGRSGVPRDNPGFQLIPLPHQAASSDLAISPGRIYVDGILCELESRLVPIIAPIVKLPDGTVQAQLAGMIVDGREFAAGQWVEVSVQDNTVEPLTVQVRAVNVSAQTLTLPATVDVAGFTGKSGTRLRHVTSYLTQPDSPSPAPLQTSGVALAYLDVWERTITALDDPEIRETALRSASGADTATRTKVVYQVRVLTVPSNTTCASAPPFETLILPSTARLAARAEPTAPVTAACILPPRAGFQRLENQLYRVQIHTGGTLASGAPTFKWSRYNAAVVTAIVSPAPTLSGTTLTLNVSSLGRDQVLNFASGQFVELTEDGRELQGKPGILAQLTGAVMGPQGPVLTADASMANLVDLTAFVNGFSSVVNPKVRRWDQSGASVSTTAPGVRAAQPGFGAGDPYRRRRWRRDGRLRFPETTQREDNLRTSLEEFLRFGLEAGIFFVD